MASQQQFELRGYYVIMPRTTTWGYPEWERYLEAMAEDGCNLVVLWMAGGYASRKFPETWGYNRAHRNNRESFSPKLVERAHELGMKVVLGFGSFCYDGVNRLPFSFPDTVATGADGQPAKLKGIHCLGQSMCPAHPGAQALMHDYVVDMMQHHPGADGIFVESSDYEVCHCEKCAGDAFFGHEWAFVERISDELWERDPEALVIIYPHYYERCDQRPDPRHVIFYTPHSAHMTEKNMALPNRKMYWELGYIQQLPHIRKLASEAADRGFAGFTMAMEAYDYALPNREQYWGAVGDRIYPFDLPWKKPETHPMDDLVIQVVRFNFEIASQRPRISDEEFEEEVGERFFDDAGAAEQTKDLLRLVEILQMDWKGLFMHRGPIAYPEDMRRVYPPDGQGGVEEHLPAIYDLAGIRRTYRRSKGTAGEMSRIAHFVLKRWAEEPTAPQALREAAGR